MPINPETMALVGIAIAIGMGFVLVRSARRPRLRARRDGQANARRKPDLVCPDKRCGRHNPAHASYCGQCGRPLKAS